MKIFKVWGSVMVVLSLMALALSGCSGDDAATAPAGTVPAAPTAVTATPGNGQVTLAWADVAGATSYNIYWSTTAGVTKATGTKVTGATSPQTVTGLTNGTPYYCVVTAVNGTGESAVSAEVSATPLPSLPAAPTGFTATPGIGEVTLAWTGVAGETYNVYWSTTPGAGLTGTPITGATNPYIHTGLTNGTQYYYVVTAVNLAGESAASPQQSAIPQVAQPAPAAPTNITATGGTGEATIAWTAVTGATKYNIYYSTTSGAGLTGSKLTDPDNVSPFVVTPLIAGTYYFVVTAEGQGESTASYEVSATVQ